MLNWAQTQTGLLLLTASRLKKAYRIIMRDSLYTRWGCALRSSPVPRCNSQIDEKERFNAPNSAKRGGYAPLNNTKRVMLWQYRSFMAEKERFRWRTIQYLFEIKWTNMYARCSVIINKKVPLRIRDVITLTGAYNTYRGVQRKTKFAHIQSLITVSINFIINFVSKSRHCDFIL